MVDYGRQRAAAESAVTGLTGVCNVNNEIAVLHDTDSADVTWHIRQALDRYAVSPHDTEVTADVSGNTVTLTGHVRTCAEHATPPAGNLYLVVGYGSPPACRALEERWRFEPARARSPTCCSRPSPRPATPTRRRRGDRGQELVASQASSGRFDRRQPDPLLAGAARDRTVTA